MHASGGRGNIPLVRLAVIGPSGGDVSMFARMVELLLNGARVDRAIYLGADDVLDETVALWAQALVGPDPTDDRIWERALEVARNGDADSIDALVRSERARLRLKSVEGLPAPNRRDVEMFGDRLVLLVHDRTLLDEDDIFSASLLIYGKSDVPLAKRIGSRWFLAPGPISENGGGGAIVLDDAAGDVEAVYYDLGGHPTRIETLTQSREARVSVQG
jgi:hypothetical protein